MKRKCPVCKKVIPLENPNNYRESEYFPFCSRRCKLVDLGSWLDGEYRIVSKHNDVVDEEN
ncbi:MAG: DNA gyrase inhibitor YacG [Planctomycetota bacterium]